MVDRYSGVLDEVLEELGSSEVTVTYVVDSRLAMTPAQSRHSVERAGHTSDR